MSGISGDRADGNWAGRDTRGRNWEDLASGNERLVRLPGVMPAPEDTARGGGAAQWSVRRGRCDLRQVVSAA